MTKRLYGGLDVTHNATAGGNRTVQSVDGALFDATGNMDLDGYTSQELREIIDVLPLSHYGTHNYLPAGVSGDFLGASENASYRRVKNTLEDDGTFVALRSGTNGSVYGLYYSYIPDLLNKTTISGSSVNSNRQYQPGYIPSTHKPVSAFSSDNGVVVGALIDNSTGALSTNFYTSIMNGTLDDTQHAGFLIPSNTVLPDGGDIVFCMLGTDGYIYYFGIITASNTYSISVVRVLFNQGAGTFTSERISGFNGTIFYPMTASANIRVAGAMTGTTLASEPYMLYPSSGIVNINPYMVSFDLFAIQDSSTGNIRIRMNGDAYCATTSDNARPQHGFSFIMNPTTKAVSIDSGYATAGNAPLRITLTGQTPVPAGNVITTDLLYNHLGLRNFGAAYNYTNLNTVICVTTPNLQRPPQIQVCTYNINVTPYQMLNFKAITSNLPAQKSGLMYESYGSIIGSFITGVELLTNTSTRQYSAQPNGSNQNSYAIHGSTPTFPFNSISFGSINGYEPTVDRSALSNAIANQIIISTVNGSTVTANGGVFIQGVRESTALSYNATMVGTGTFSVNSTAFANLKTSEFAKIAEPMSSTASKDCTLYIPQQTDIPAFALFSTVSPTLGYVYRFIEVNVSARSGVVNTVTFKRLVAEGTNAGANMQTSAQGTVTASSTGVTIYNGGTFYFVGGADPFVRNTIGDSLSYYFRGIVDKATVAFTRFDMDSSYTSYTSLVQPFALPNQGFGVARLADQNCKMVFWPRGTTIADYDAWVDTTTTPLNIVSQDVAQGFVVYFTEDTPVLLSGKSFNLPVSSIDLTTITPNPANKTFYVYVRMVQGVAQYDISESVIAETGTTAYNLFWIGTITTNSTQISAIDIKKRSRLDIFGESLEAAGSSFPVSYGMPSSSGTINW